MTEETKEKMLAAVERGDMWELRRLLAQTGGQSRNETWQPPVINDQLEGE